MLASAVIHLIMLSDSNQVSQYAINILHITYYITYYTFHSLPESESE